MLTLRQAFVHAHLDEVVDWPYLLQVRSARNRYRLGDWDCTEQVTSLLAKGLIREVPGGRCARERSFAAMARPAGPHPSRACPSASGRG